MPGRCASGNARAIREDRSPADVLGTSLCGVASHAESEFKHPETAP